jgi:DNA (cytosine-5)-methyltransferase 1
MEGYYIKKLGQNRGAPRVWLEGTQTERAGFTPGQRFDIEVQGKMVVLQANPDGSRVVSGKKTGERNNPVIDINSKELLAMFDGMAALRVVVKKDQIYLMPLASEVKKRERYGRMREKLESGDPLTIGSLSHGGGVLSHAIHSGLKSVGVDAQLAFANEIRGELLEHASIHNDAWSENTQVLAAPMQELAFDDRGVASIPKVEIMEMGLPCSGASRAGKSKRGLEHPESHPLVGHLVVSALVIVSKANPAIVILENVPEYAQSASADILRNQLRDMGYVTHERVLNGKSWGSLENRNRWCMIAVTDGIAFDFDQLRPPIDHEKTVGSILDKDIGPDDPRWRSFDYLKTKEVRDHEKGNGFGMQIVNPEDNSVPTLRKGYHKGGSTDPLLQHPEDSNLLRQFTAEEHARIKEVPPHLIAGLSNTIGHEVLGQGIVYSPFMDVGAHLGEALNSFAGKDPVITDQALPDSKLLEIIRVLGIETNLELDYAVVGGHEYIGEIVAIDYGVFVQNIDGARGVVHDGTRLNSIPDLGRLVAIEYEQGVGLVKERQQQFFEAIGAVNEGSYNGKVVNINGGVVTQKIGREELVHHELSKLEGPISIGEVVDIKYKAGLGSVAPKQLDLVMEIGR